MSEAEKKESVGLPVGKGLGVCPSPSSDSKTSGSGAIQQVNSQRPVETEFPGKLVVGPEGLHLPVVTASTGGKSDQTDDTITREIAEAIDRGFDIKKWIVALVKFVGWRQGLLLLAGFGCAWLLAYLGVLEVRNAPKSQAEMALSQFGIEDIASRDDTNSAPRSEFIASARNSILITGFSAFRTVENNPDTLKHLLEKKVDIYMLVLHPQSPDVQAEEAIEGGSEVRKNQRTSIEIVVKRYFGYSNFHLKFMNRLPGVTGIVVDAEIEPSPKPLRSRGGRLRYQIKGFRIPQRKGFVVQVAQSPNEDNPMFNLFWTDFRAQWQDGLDASEVLPTIGIAPSPSSGQQ